MVEKKKNMNLEHLRKKHNEKVKGIFRFHENEGGTLHFPFREFKGDEIKHYSLKDGNVYDLPLGVAIHLNKNCWYPVHSYAQDEDGNPSQIIGKKINRCSFQSLEFMDVEELSSERANSIVTVKSI